MEIRRVYPDSPAALLHDLTDLLVASVDGGASLGWLPPLAPDLAHAFWVGQAGDPGNHVLVALDDDDRALGTVTLAVPWQTNAPHRAEVKKLVVHPARRRSGIGQSLLTAVEGLAASLGRPALLLDTARGGGAQQLYLRAGWTVVAEIEDYVRDVDGRPLATVLMQRRLDA